jgi:F-type H+-transporting ATPase subunit gamma
MALRVSLQRISSTLPRLAAKAGAARGMATEKQIFNQIQSTKNIAKITSSMKMVSAAKL